MRKIGLIGGMSWESTAVYYRLINQGVAEQLGGLNSAEVILESLNFQEISELQKNSDWEAAAKVLLGAAQRLEKVGAQCILIATNTMHMVAEAVQNGISIPLLHIADSCGKALLEQNISSTILLGTKFTMEQNFYSARLKEKFGIEVVVPDSKDREIVHSVIYDELCKGIVRPESRQIYLDIVNKLAVTGVQSVILGCTEIGMLISQSDLSIKVFDTTILHTGEAIRFSLRTCQVKC